MPKTQITNHSFSKRFNIRGQRYENRCRFEGEVQVVPLAGKSDPIWGITKDICLRGVFINATRQPGIDCTVTLNIYSLYGALQVKAKVVHKIPGVGFGCEFIDLNPLQRVSLNFLVRQT